MKKLALKALIAGSILMVTGCGSDDSKSKRASVNDVPSNIRMQKNKQYTVEKGDEIEKLSSNPKLKLESDLNSGKTIVTLLSGEAAIIKK